MSLNLFFLFLSKIGVKKPMWCMDCNKMVCLQCNQDKCANSDCKTGKLVQISKFALNKLLNLDFRCGNSGCKIGVMKY